MTTHTHRRRGLPPAATPLVAVVAGLVACAVAARATGAMDALVFVEDAGPLVRWSVPLVRVVHDVAASVTLGALLFAAFFVPDAGPDASARAARSGTHTGPNAQARATAPALRVATISGLVWTVAALLGVLLTFADAAGLPLGSQVLMAQLGELVWQIDATRIGLISAACAFVVTSGAALARGRVAAAWLAALAGAGIVVLGLASHTGTSDDHESSVNAMGLHLVGATTWVGGLIVLVMLHRTFAPTLAVVARRYSTLALWSFVTVGASGVVAATTRLGGWSDLGTAYGLLVVAKVVLFVALGAAGAWHRRSTIADLDAGLRGRPFLRLAVVEVALMGAAFGVATALSRSAPPVPEDFPDPTPTLQITGFPAPPPMGSVPWWELWRADWLVLAVVLVALGLYAGGIASARVKAARALVASRGDLTSQGAAPPSVRGAAPLPIGGWSIGRAAAWVVGWLLLAWATGGPLGVYGRVSLAWHLALVLVIVFVVAPLLVAAAPVTLARRALAPRTDGTIGPREVVVALADSLPARWLRGPVVATVLLLVVLALLLGTGLLELALTTHPGHLMMLGASLAVGIVWARAVLWPPESAGLPVRVLGCLGAVALAAFGAALWLSRAATLLAGDVFARFDLPWLSDLAAEQARAGAVALFVVVPSCVVLAAAVTLRPHLERPRRRAAR